jgi:hypothetical protein
MKKDITMLFCFVDEKVRNPTRKPELSVAEIITIILMYQQSPCKNFYSTPHLL